VRSTQSFGHGHHFDIKGQVQGDVILILANPHCFSTFTY